eukprot:COSAG01_NODE_9957_length_2292_cov_7.086183_1_plen_77_part_10
MVSSGGALSTPQCAHTILKAIVPLGWVLLVVLAGLSVEKYLLSVVSIGIGIATRRYISVNPELRYHDHCDAAAVVLD